MKLVSKMFSFLYNALMEQLENNIYFWQKLDTLLLSCTCTIDHPQGSRHAKYTNLIYPFDYGYLCETVGHTDDHINIYMGPGKTNQVQAIAVTADILKKDCVVKLITGCTDEEMATILQFLNSTEFQKAILIKRGAQTPQWAVTE
jgi:inorganic pyrophosphatase